MSHKIVFLDTATIPTHITLPTPSFPHQWQSYPITTSDQIVERCRDASILITNKVMLNKDTLSQLPKLQLIAIAATGTNNVDLAACQALGIKVCNIRNYAAQSVTEHVMGMIFSLRRNLFGYHSDIQNGEWQRHGQFCFFTHPIGNVSGTTLGIIGRGNLGQAVGTTAKALGMKVMFAEHKGADHCRDGYYPFEEVITQADVISLHCPLTEKTQNIIEKTTLKAMKNNAILINTGRGGLVDEEALVQALQEGEIAAAGVDVFTEEPANELNPLIAQAHLPNLLLTPHVAWGSDSAITTLVHQLFENIQCFVEGRPQNLVV
ncbi:D-2-hydroxyacid dehydrogenase [Thaumasiovibrio subtropicus]|uniref:D-2-hydroxyacid dehydrogenase n=1 Tax=Thaumasiovibrio subtropicus TaxID=1891207 RepID=UPI000B354AA4|nr:D-2-hydroxyacid dehydrogenase [Thaumasiovibrio subtropicus]